MGESLPEIGLPVDNAGALVEQRAAAGYPRGAMHADPVHGGKLFRRADD